MKILISACLLGQNVRYDGKNSKIENKLFDKISQKVKLIPFCPEVEGGLPIPRIPSEIVQSNPLKLKNKEGMDTTKEFVDGANKALKLCQEQNIKIALLKAKSPSCGNKQIYDGSFNKKLIKGAGVTAKLFMQNKIEVFDENELELLRDKINQYV